MGSGSNTAGRGVFHDDFRLSITKALGDQLAVALEDLGRAPLSEESLSELKDRPGVYQLYVNGGFVYVGKADKSLPSRLRNHLRKLSGRRNISLTDVSFSCLYVDEDFSALAPEQLLITHHKGLGDIPWNNNGFGNKDPGKQRDHTVLKKAHFDVKYPIDLESLVEGLRAGPTTLPDFLKALKTGLPYNFRYGGLPASASQTALIVRKLPMTADEAFRLISEVMPGGWQITALMGYVVMYPEAPKEYASAWRYYRGGVAIDSEPEASSEPLSTEDLGESES
jgi:hypothetical protein